VDSINDENRRLIYHYQELEQAVNVAREQMNSIQNNIFSGESTINTIESLAKSGSGVDDSDSAESIIPIGSGCFVHAEIKNVSKIVINVGSGAAIEKSTEDAIEYIKNRNNKFREMLEDMNKSLITITQKMNEIEQTLRSENS